jgi:hypothetical protein
MENSNFLEVSLSELLGDAGLDVWFQHNGATTDLMSCVRFLNRRFGCR